MKLNHDKMEVLLYGGSTCQLESFSLCLLGGYASTERSSMQLMGAPGPSLISGDTDSIGNHFNQTYKTRIISEI